MPAVVFVSVNLTGRSHLATVYFFVETFCNAADDGHIKIFQGFRITILFVLAFYWQTQQSLGKI